MASKSPLIKINFVLLKIEIYRYRYWYQTRIGTIIENISFVSNVKYF